MHPLMVASGYDSTKRSDEVVDLAAGRSGYDVTKA